MGVKCQIKRNSNSEITQVLDSRGEPSELYQELVRKVGSKTLALDMWASAYTDDFTDFAYDVKTLQLEPSLEELTAFWNESYLQDNSFSFNDKNAIYNSFGRLNLSPTEVVRKLYKVFRIPEMNAKQITTDDLVNTGVYNLQEAINILEKPDVLGSVALNIRKLYLESLKEDNFLDKIEPNESLGLALSYSNEIDFLGKSKLDSENEILQELNDIAKDSVSEQDFIDRIQYFYDDAVVKAFNEDEGYFNKVLDIYRRGKQIPIYREENGELVDTNYSSMGIKTKKSTKQVKLYNSLKSNEQLYELYGLIPISENTYLRVDNYSTYQETLEQVVRYVETMGFNEVFGEQPTTENIKEALQNMIDDNMEEVSKVYKNLDTNKKSQIILYSKLFNLPLYNTSEKILDREIAKVQYIGRTGQVVDTVSFPNEFLDFAQDLLYVGNDIFEGFFEIDNVLMLDDIFIENLANKLEAVASQDVIQDLKLYGALENRSNVSNLFSYDLQRDITDNDLRVVYLKNPNLLEEYFGDKKKTTSGFEIDTKERFLNIGGAVFENNGVEFVPIDINHSIRVVLTDYNDVDMDVEDTTQVTQKQLKQVNDEMDNCG